MKRLILAAGLMFAATAVRAQYLGAGSNPNSHPVQGYTTNNGTYVAPHQQTNPNTTQRGNCSATGNVNPIASLYRQTASFRPPQRLSLLE